jgi:hypothetical protein
MYRELVKYRVGHRQGPTSYNTCGDEAEPGEQETQLNYLLDRSGVN